MFDYKKIFQDFSNKTILIVGDVMLDAYLWGKVNRISPEAPVPIVSVTKRESRLGGAANVALNIRALGAKAILGSVIGDDEKGKLFYQLLSKRELTSAGVISSKERKTTVKTRIISGTQHTLRVDEEITSFISEELQQELIKRTKLLIETQHIDALIFQDYDKGVLTPFVIKELTDFANAKAVPVLVDPKKRNFEQFHNATLFKPNFKELIEGLKMEIEKSDTKALHTAAKDFLKQYNITNIMITLSELGVFICDAQNHYHLPAKIRKISDVSGAGDTVISVAALCLASGLDMKNIATVANIAGGLVCEHAGVVPIDKELLLQEITK